MFQNTWQKKLGLLEKEADWLAGELHAWEVDQAYPGVKTPTIKEIREDVSRAVSWSNGIHWPLQRGE